LTTATIRCTACPSVGAVAAIIVAVKTIPIQSRLIPFRILHVAKAIAFRVWRRAC
jgi:hypothetical protein